MSKTMMYDGLKKRHGLFFLGLAVLLSGAVVVALFFNTFMYWSLGFLVCLIGVWLMRASKASDLNQAHATYRSASVNALTLQRAGRLAWMLGAVSTLALVGSFVALYVDAAYGSHWEWPLYAIGLSVFACVVSWGYVALKMGWFIP